VAATHVGSAGRVIRNLIRPRLPGLDPYLFGIDCHGRPFGIGGVKRIVFDAHAVFGRLVNCDPTTVVGKRRVAAHLDMADRVVRIEEAPRRAVVPDQVPALAA
jgi:hypothetical protein